MNDENYMYITVEMACSINGLIATENGNEDFLSNRNYQIMLEFLKEYDCLVWGNTTFKNVVSWGNNYIEDLKNITVVVFSKEENVSMYDNVIYCNSLEHFYDICSEKGLNKIFVSGGATTNTLFLKNNLVKNIIINYNPYVLNNGINLFQGDYFEQELELDKIVNEQDGIVQVWYNVKEKKQMAKEYFDLLDENGNKTGKIKLRSEVHRDGDWHKAVHIWIINDKGEILLQRRCATKDSNPNMLDISSAGHLSAGDDSLSGALRELKEELNIDIEDKELQFVKTLKRSSKYSDTFINNEFDDLYILKTNKKIEDMEFQKEEISEIFFIPYKQFKEMISNKQPDLLMHDDEFEILFNMFDKEFDK